MRYLHTMIRVSDLEESLNFFKLLDIHEVSRKENEQARFTLVFLSAIGDEKLVENAKSPLIELTFNWDEKDYDGGRNFGGAAIGLFRGAHERCRSTLRFGSRHVEIAGCTNCLGGCR